MSSGEHAPQNAMTEAGEIERFHDRCSDLMRELLGELAETPDRPRTFPDIEDAIGWPRRRIASVLGGVSHLRHTEFGGRRPYRFLDDRNSASGRWEMWADSAQAAALVDSASTTGPLGAGRSCSEARRRSHSPSSPSTVESRAETSASAG